MDKSENISINSYSCSNKNTKTNIYPILEGKSKNMKIIRQLNRIHMNFMTNFLDQKKIVQSLE